MAIGPAPVLALLVGGFQTALFLFLRGRGGARLAISLAAATLGAWAGDAVGGRLGIDPIWIGDFHVIAASLVAGAGDLVRRGPVDSCPSNASDRRP